MTNRFEASRIDGASLSLVLDGLGLEKMTLEAASATSVSCLFPRPDPEA